MTISTGQRVFVLIAEEVRPDKWAAVAGSPDPIIIRQVAELLLNSRKDEGVLSAAVAEGQRHSLLAVIKETL